MDIAKSSVVFGTLVVLCVAAAAARSDQQKAQAGPQLLFPSTYRQWVYLSSGLDMQYVGEPKLPCKESPCPSLFENVYVRRDFYDAFLKNRVWPVGTVMVLEKRCAAQKVSIDTNGSVQQKLFLVAASQKTAVNGWNYYLFGNDAPLTCSGPDPNFSGQKKDPTSNNDPKIAGICWQCHRDHGAVDNTFVQFYPTLKSSGTEKID